MGGDKSFAEKKLKDLNEAYEILSNKSSREEYDKKLAFIREKSSNIKNSNEIFNKDDILEQKQDLEKRYNDMYKYDYYKKYTTNYYGVDKSNKKDAYINTSTDSILNNIKNSLNKLFQNVQIKVILLIILISILIGLITTYFLVSKIQKLFDSSSSNFSSSRDNTSKYYNYIEVENILSEQFNNYINSYIKENFNGVIKIGISASEVESFYGKPDKYEENSNVTYAYYKSSYIIYNKSKIVIRYKNNGYFLTEDILNQFYNKHLN